MPALKYLTVWQNDSHHGCNETLAEGQPQRLRENLYNLLIDPTCITLADLTISAENKEIKAHKCVLAASSPYFRRLFASSSTTERIEFHLPWRVVEQIIYCFYGGCIDLSMEPEIILDVLAEARHLEMSLFQNADYIATICKKVNLSNCFTIIVHGETAYHSQLLRHICHLVASNFHKVTKLESARDILKTLNKKLFIRILSEALPICTKQPFVKDTLQFLLERSSLENLCDLLRECKTWEWKSDIRTLKNTTLPDEQVVITEDDHNQVNKELRDNTEIVHGRNFDWVVHIDKGQDGHFRLVYDTVHASKNLTSDACIRLFPAAMVKWEIAYDNSIVSQDEAVMICFPENVSLHWSTILPIQLEQAQQKIAIRLKITENPLVSMILYHFAHNMQELIALEDIFNRLPHIEYRCLSSLSLVKQA